MEDDINITLLGEYYNEFIDLVNSPSCKYEILQLCWMEVTWGFEHYSKKLKVKKFSKYLFIPSNKIKSSTKNSFSIININSLF